jgi:hypothetical protein
MEDNRTEKGRMGRKRRMKKGDETEPCRLSFGFAVLPIGPSFPRVYCTHVFSL